MTPALLAAPSTADLAAYQRDGFHIGRSLFTSDEIAALRDAAMAQVGLGPVAGLYDGYHHFGSADPLSRHPRMLMPHRHTGLEIGRLCERRLFDPRLQPWLAGFLGEEACAAQSMFYFKPPGARGQDMHQDDFYLRTAPKSCLAAWVAVDDVDDENGGLRVVAGSHRLPLLPTRQADLTTYFADDGVDVPAGMAVVAPVLAPGDVLFFGGAVIHGSGPNRSPDRFRRSFIGHYVGASTIHINPWNRPVEGFDRRIIEVAEAPVGPWQDSFAGRRQGNRPH
jgi:phytanoyl-CoA hydroxylase